MNGPVIVTLLIVMMVTLLIIFPNLLHTYYSYNLQSGEQRDGATMKKVY